jgi:hypothetical protein
VGFELEEDVSSEAVRAIPFLNCAVSFTSCTGKNDWPFPEAKDRKLKRRKMCNFIKKVLEPLLLFSVFL